MNRPLRIILTGFSGTGKTKVSRLVAARLGWQAVDTDDLIVQRAGKPIPDIFAQDGEDAFRRIERDALTEVCRQSRTVIGIGGGANVSGENRRIMADGGFVVCLQARPETILKRLRPQLKRDPGARPMLAGADPLARVRELKALRAPFYALADCTVHTDALSPQQVADEVTRAWQELSGATLAKEGRLAALTADPTPAALARPYHPPADATCVVRAASASYPVFVSWGALPNLGRRLAQVLPAEGRAFLIADANVHERWGAAAEEALRSAGFGVAVHTVPAGEASKTLDTAATIYDWLVTQRAERGEAIVALGGGMVCDLAGFVAATFARGLPLVHVPTSLLAMVDAAVGGKVAVDHPKAKNLIGAFYQPRLVLADIAVLQTLPPRELTAGWAEVIKHALIMDEDLLLLLEENAEDAQCLRPEIAERIIARSVALKATVVSEDEREETGRRMILNYGHTIGHGLEAAAGYAGLHGEAVAIGMSGAARIAVRLGMLAPAVAQRQDALLARFGLPLRAPGVDAQKALAAMALDKKAQSGALRWVLLEGIGRAVIRRDVPPSLVEEVVAELTAIQP